jgi:hypothetical protein
VPPAGFPDASARFQTSSLVSSYVEKLVVWSRTLPRASRTIRKTPSAVSWSTSSLSGSSLDSKALAAATARLRTVSSTPESRASRSSRKSERPSARRMAPMINALKSVRRHRIGKS